MTCAKIFLIILSLVIIALTLWPMALSAITTKWIILVAAILIIVISMSGCKCAWCCDMKEAKVPAKRKR